MLLRALRYSGSFARLSRDGLSFGARAGLLQQGFTSFSRELGEDKIVGFTKQGGEFLPLQGVLGFQRDPLRASQVRRGDDAGALGELREIFR